MNRQKPIKYLKHKEFGKVPVIEINKDHIVWDDNQWSRTDPPEPMYNISDIEEFEVEDEVLRLAKTLAEIHLGDSDILGKYANRLYELLPDIETFDE